ncbi:endonuclease/exonuclease/phosphatase family protein [Cetobacterium sp. C33]|uniref:Endonuclease/exonuclease/phosphatase family protein n=2 Tax=Fusobacteriaceae TaxID=203492 RepID=A0ABU4W7I9_9FUSO|nr:endonuclease/exonuclease/phosphatase family protein [Candidatus Cetobacterium colombiensis]MDX8335491.1 endonuclease/exonuclease/phosphatase family protein [Candidatus Cetobacterium colombiensis]
MIFIYSFSFSATPSEEKAYIGSFNTLRLGKNQKDYEHLARSIEAFDIVGLVEVMNKSGLYKLLSEVQKISNSKWGYEISPYPVGTDEYKEYYAFLYKKDKVKFIKSEGFYPDEKDEFIREPYGATFKINNFDFTFVLIHSIYGKKVSQRQYEASKIIDVYNYFQNLDPNESDILIGGDFNLPANDSSFENLLSHKDEIIYSLDPSIKTTIGTKGFANSYDNIFLSKKYTQEFKGNSGALDITRNDFIKTRKEVSDHLPIFIVVDTDFDDD